jgi:hypothetical protein
LKPSVRTVRPGIRFGSVRFGCGAIEPVTPNVGKVTAAVSTVSSVCALPAWAAGS